MDIKYDIPFEVTKDQYMLLMKKLPGVVAGRFDGAKYFIKVWDTRFSEYITKIINNLS